MSDGRRTATSFVDVASRDGGFSAARSRFTNPGTWIGSAIAALAITACASAPADRAFDPQLAGNVNDAATQAAVAKPGTKVCRPVQLGISEKDWISGVVQQADGKTLRVRIDDPGRFPKSLNGQLVSKGESLTDAAAAWTPCRS